MIFPATFELSSLNGSNGFVINGISASDRLGFSVSSAGDVNGDGIADLTLLNAPGAGTGQGYIIFGRSGGLPPSFNVSSLNGVNGFRINGISRGNANLSRPSIRSAGDINGDGLDDMIIESFEPDDSSATAGRGYVVFGRGSGSGDLDVASLNGNNGFRITGLIGRGGSFSFASETSANSAGDINGDGLDDLIVGAAGADLSGSFIGQSYVIFGRRTGHTAEFDINDLDGINGFRINGVSANDFSGFSTDSIGDFNGDGLDDLVIGAPGAGDSDAGEAYILFGRQGGFPAALGLSALNGSNGFRLFRGTSGSFNIGRSVSNAGDVNGDGLEDLFLGSQENTFASGFVVFGRRGTFSPSFDLDTLNGSNGFRILERQSGAFTGFAVSSAGDVNDDGFDDLLINGHGADAFLGESYVIYGRAGGFGATVSLAALDGTNGFRMRGTIPEGGAGFSISGAGDVNNDGIDDLIVSAPFATVDGNFNIGQAYVIYGVAGPIAGLTLTTPTVNTSGLAGSVNANLASGSLQLNLLPRRLNRDITGFQNVVGTSFNDRLFGNGGANLLSGNGGNDRIKGGGGGDRLLGGNGNDFLVGAGGADQLTGGVGVDTMRGGGGRDRFTFDMGRNFRRPQMEIDQMVDFRPRQDKIVIDRTTFRAFPNNRISFASVANPNQARRSNALITYVRGTGALFYNPNGAAAGFGPGGQFAVVQNRVALGASDFIVQA